MYLLYILYYFSKPWLPGPSMGFYGVCRLLWKYVEVNFVTKLGSGPKVVVVIVVVVVVVVFFFFLGGGGRSCILGLGIV